jgi:mono/diheme cytochrome c family protein
MPSYATEISPEDRWAIVAFIRALQLSQNAGLQDVPTGVTLVSMQTLLRWSGRPQAFLDSWEPVNAGGGGVANTSTPNSIALITGSAKTYPEKAHGHSANSSKGNLDWKKASGGETIANGANSGEHSEKRKAGDPVHGKQIYLANCAPCHQPSRSGLPPRIPTLVGICDHVDMERVRTVAKVGIPDAIPPMPPHPDLKETEIDDLVAFLRTK